MYSLHTNLLCHIFLFLHPLTLQECKLVCKSWYQVIIQRETAKWFFMQRYHRPPPEDITFWQQYFPLPGGEQYRSLTQCYRDTLHSKDYLSYTYFKKKGNFDNYWQYDIFHVHGQPLTKPDFDFIRSFVEYVGGFNYFREYGSLVGLYGDLDVYKQELAKIPRYAQSTFVEGFLKGLCYHGHPDLEIILTYPEVAIALDNINHLNIVFHSDHSGIPLIVEYLTPVQALMANIKLYSHTQIMACILEIDEKIKDILTQLITQRSGFGQYIMQHHSEYYHIIETPRAWVYRDNCHGWQPRRCKLYLVYQQIILEGDWEIYDDFVETFYRRRHGNIGKNPPQRLLYGAMDKLIQQGYLQRIYEVLVRLDQLHVSRRDVFYKHCLYSAIRYGKKDLVDYFLLYTGNQVFPLPRPCKHTCYDVRKYIDHLNKIHQG